MANLHPHSLIESLKFFMILARAFKPAFIAAGSMLTFFSFCNAEEAAVPTTRIAFGSCAHQDLPQPILQFAAEQKPDAFIYLGDNIYADTDDMDELRAKYQRLGSKPEFKQLASATRILATWDDHDYGKDDSGAKYPFKDESKKIFMEFFREPETSGRRNHPGIYQTEYIRSGDRVIQVILLDVRSFRSDQLHYDGKTPRPPDQFFYRPEYSPDSSPDKTMLGEEQWKWLEGELKKPADLRLICSGSQFGPEFNGYEAWANFPHEQQRMLDLIKSTRAEGVIFLTGDVHYAEISRLDQKGLYPIYDITASGITQQWQFATPNANRIEGPVMDNHFGLLTVTWEKDPAIRMEIIDRKRNSRIEYTIKASEVRFPRQKVSD